MSVFHFRGPLSVESQLFKGRQVDINKLVRWCGGEIQHYGIVFGARQSGKTSLLLRLEKLLSTSHVVCHIDFEYFSDALPARVFGALSQEIARALGEPDPGDQMGDPLHFSEFLCHTLDAHASERIVLLVEEMGALPKSCRFSLANTLRAIFHDRLKPTRRALTRFMVMVAGNTELYDLAYTDVSPFANICETHYLGDLTVQETQALVTEALSMLDIPPNISFPMGLSIYERTYGYPYLVQRLGYVLESAYEDGKELKDIVLDDALEVLLSNGDPLLEYIHKAVLEQNLISSVQSVLTENLRFNRHEEALARLELIGLIHNQGGYWYVRNPFFARAIQTWLTDFERNEESTLTRGIIRIYNQQGVPVGAGFLLNDKRILTCAHVVASALGVNHEFPPAGEISLDFPLLSKPSQIRARVEFTQSYQDGKVNDIAVLELLDETPHGAVSLSLARVMPQWGKSFRVYGFPAGREDGVWADGEVRERISDGRFQLIDVRSTGYIIQPGFSGSPVWDENAKGVIGMIVAADTDKAVKAAFMIPVRELQKALEH